MRLYDFFVLPTLLCGSETRNLTKVNLKQLEAARHRWQRKILGTVSGRTKSRMKNYARKRTQTAYKSHFEGTTFKTVGPCKPHGDMQSTKVRRISDLREIGLTWAKWQSVVHGGKGKWKGEYLYSAIYSKHRPTLKALGHGSHIYICQLSHTCLLCGPVCFLLFAEVHRSNCLNITTKFRIWQTRD